MPPSLPDHPTTLTYFNQSIVGPVLISLALGPVLGLTFAFALALIGAGWCWCW